MMQGDVDDRPRKGGLPGGEIPRWGGGVEESDRASGMLEGDSGSGGETGGVVS